MTLFLPDADLSGLAAKDTLNGVASKNRQTLALVAAVDARRGVFPSRCNCSAHRVCLSVDAGVFDNRPAGGLDHEIHLAIFRRSVVREREPRR